MSFKVRKDPLYLGKSAYRFIDRGMNHKMHVNIPSKLATGIIISSSFCLILAFLLSSTSVNQNKTYGDGLSEEQLPPFIVNDKRVVLYTKVIPSILTTQNTQDRFIEVRLVDYDTEETVRNVTYSIVLEKDNHQLIRDLFSSELGPLWIKVEPHSNYLKITNFTSHKDGIWHSQSGNITIQGPILLDPGLYHFSIGVIGLAGVNHTINNTSIQTVINDKNILKLDTWLSIPDQINKHLVYNGTNYNVTVISYYDKLKNIKFLPNDRIFSWEIPFDWNISRIINQSIIVHQEIKIPRSFFNDGRFYGYNATVNNLSLGGRSVAVDPFSSKNYTTVHLLVNKQEILEFVKRHEIDTSDKVMLFRVSSTPRTISDSLKDLVTDSGGIYISLTWVPKKLEPNTPSTMYLKFLNAEDNSPLSADITYGIKITDERGNSVIERSGQTALFNQNGSQEIMFPRKGTYGIQIYVEGLSPLSTDSLDTSRNGIARGYLAVG
jgi:hypothetical protein